MKKTAFHRPQPFLAYCILQTTNWLSVEQAEKAGEGFETTHGQVETAHDCVRSGRFETGRIDEFCRHPDGGSWVVQLLWPCQVIQQNSQTSTWFILLNSLSSAFISFSYFHTSLFESLILAFWIRISPNIKFKELHSITSFLGSSNETLIPITWAVNKIKCLIVKLCRFWEVTWQIELRTTA